MLAHTLPAALPLERLRLLALGLLLCGAWGVPPARAQAPVAPALDAQTLERLELLAKTGAQAGAPAGARVEVELGQLDGRLRLAPCRQIQPYLPSGFKMWGRTRIGVRCVDGQARWNVSLPLQVRVHAPALVAAQALPAGTVLAQEHLRLAEIDIAVETGMVFPDAQPVLGRQLAQPLAAGEAVRSQRLTQRRWFAAGEQVKVVVAGAGYAVEGLGRAMEPGLEGQPVRVRFDNGRMVTGRAVGDRQVEVLL